MPWRQVFGSTPESSNQSPKRLIVIELCFRIVNCEYVNRTVVDKSVPCGDWLHDFEHESEGATPAANNVDSVQKLGAEDDRQRMPGEARACHLP
jgi:hypothetical protein